MVHPVIFDALNASIISSAALHTNGVTGPSGINAYGWQRLCTSFGDASNDLCTAVTLLQDAYALVTHIDPRTVAPSWRVA